MSNELTNDAFAVGIGGAVIGGLITVAGVVVGLGGQPELGVPIAAVGVIVAVDAVADGFALSDAAGTFSKAADYAGTNGSARVTLYQGELGSTLIANGDRNRHGLWGLLAPQIVENLMDQNGGW